MIGCIHSDYGVCLSCTYPKMTTPPVGGSSHMRVSPAIIKALLFILIKQRANGQFEVMDQVNIINDLRKELE